VRLNEWQEDDEPDFGDPLADPPIPPGAYMARDIRPADRTQPAPLYAPISVMERARVACEKRVAGACVAAFYAGDCEAVDRFRAMLDTRPWQYDPVNWVYPGTEHGAMYMDLALRGRIADLVKVREREMIGPAEPLDESGLAERKKQLRRQAEGLGAIDAKGANP